MTRVGWGFDAHRFGSSDPLMLCGVEVPSGPGLVATSDGDVALHAVIDSILGAAALGDLGEHFPSSDPRWHGVASRVLLVLARDLVEESGRVVSNIDVTIVAESVLIAPHRFAMREVLADSLGLDLDAVSVKASSTDGMGFVGRDEGIAATAVATLEDAGPQA